MYESEKKIFNDARYDYFYGENNKSVESWNFDIAKLKNLENRPCFCWKYGIWMIKSVKSKKYVIFGKVSFRYMIYRAIAHIDQIENKKSLESIDWKYYKDCTFKPLPTDVGDVYEEVEHQWTPGYLFMSGSKILSCEDINGEIVL